MSELFVRSKVTLTASVSDIMVKGWISCLVVIALEMQVEVSVAQVKNYVGMHFSKKAGRERCQFTECNVCPTTAGMQ